MMLKCITIGKLLGPTPERSFKVSPHIKRGVFSLQVVFPALPLSLGIQECCSANQLLRKNQKSELRCFVYNGTSIPEYACLRPKAVALQSQVTENTKVVDTILCACYMRHV